MYQYIDTLLMILSSCITDLCLLPKLEIIFVLVKNKRWEVFFFWLDTIFRKINDCSYNVWKDAFTWFEKQKQKNKNKKTRHIILSAIYWTYCMVKSLNLCIMFKEQCISIFCKVRQINMQLKGLYKSKIHIWLHQ